MVTPIAGVQSQAQVAAGGLTGGADIEVDTALRARLLARIRQPPHGGALHDYVAWALEIPGITRVWPVAGELGVGTVTVRFVRDDDTDPIPDAAEVVALQAHLDAVRPVTAQVFAVAPIPVALDLQIRLTPNSTTVQAAVTAELQDLLRREAEPGATLLLSHIREAISIATGETDHELLAPVANVEHAAGEMPVLGTITWL